ncbi:hypothetical protein NPIL_31921 [Nephila pilipes]|uniref:Uncharacterized protein n=1 Tax=Nephila pilipes TaxID=299642 RepID=A0A8X6QZH3_NEPPI|nr:hypothetical protein NPIL_31921 [Nephila pilipes]
MNTDRSKREKSPNRQCVAAEVEPIPRSMSVIKLRRMINFLRGKGYQVRFYFPLPPGVQCLDSSMSSPLHDLVNYLKKEVPPRAHG